jgi:hypothetical protein
MGSQHILLHLYQGVKSDSRNSLYARFDTSPVGIQGTGWITGPFNPIFAMLALSDSQDLAYLHFSGQVDLGCAGRILKILREVKREPSAFICLLDDLTKAMEVSSPIDLALILKPVKQAMILSHEEATTPFLCLIASRLQECRQRLKVWEGDWLMMAIAAETQRICDLLQSKYAANSISSTAQLHLLSCALSTTVAQPATGRIRMHEDI